MANYLKALSQHSNKYGHCNDASIWSNDKEFKAWVATQRKLYRQGSLSQEQIKILDSIGFAWDPADILWEKKL